MRKFTVTLLILYLLSIVYFNIVKSSSVVNDLTATPTVIFAPPLPHGTPTPVATEINIFLPLIER